MEEGILTDVSRLPERYKLELLRGERVQAELDILEQRRLKAASDQIQRHFIDGLGEQTIIITRNMAARLRTMFGQSCLHDPDFLRRIKQRNPFFRVKATPRALTLRVNGLRPVPKSANLQFQPRNLQFSHENR